MVQQTKSWEFLAHVDNDAGTTVIIGTTPTKTVIASTSAGTEAAWDCRVTVDDSDDTLQVEGLGSVSETIYWQASIRAVQNCTTLAHA